MKNKIALIVAVVLGLVAAYGIHQYIRNLDKAHAQKFKEVEIIVANKRIEAGTIVASAEMFATSKIAESNAVRQNLLRGDAPAYVGLAINRTVEPGEPILQSYFRQPVERLEAKLVQGQRAITLRVDAITGVAGNIVPGSHVDIIGTFPLSAPSSGAMPGTTGSVRTGLLLPNVTVIAVDSSSVESQYVSTSGIQKRVNYSSITVGVTPEEANVLVFAQVHGTLTMALRSLSDVGTDKPVDVTAQNLPNLAAEAAREREKRLRETPSIKSEPRR